MDKINDEIKKPDFPGNTILYENDKPKHWCPQCGSSLKRNYLWGWLFVGRSKHCIKPECPNFFAKNMFIDGEHTYVK